MSGPYNPVPTVAPQAEPTGYENANPTADAFGAGVAKGLENVGQATQEAEEKQFATALHFQQMKNETDALEATTSFSRQLGDIELEYRQLRGNNAPGQLPAFQQRVEKLQQQTMGTLKSPDAQREFLGRARTYADGALKGMGAWAGDQAEQAHVGALNGSIGEAKARIVRSAGIDDGEANFEELTTNVARMGQFMGWDKTQTDAFLQKQTGDALSDVVESRIAAGHTDQADQIFQHVIKQTIPGTDLPMLDGDHQARISQTIANRQYLEDMRAQRVNAKAAAGMRVGIINNITNATAMIERGIAPPTLPTDSDIDAAYPDEPERAQIMKDNVDGLRATAGYLAVLPGATPDQIRHLEAQTAPDPAKPDTFAHQARIASALDAALKARNKQLYGTPPTDAEPNGGPGDPASYVIQTHNEMPEALAAGLQDPKAFELYAHNMETIQTTMGMPDAKQHLLPSFVAQQLVQGLTAAPETAPAKFRDLRQQYGDRWPKIFKDMVQLGHMPPQFQAVGVLPSADAATLARALGEGGKEGKDLVSMLPGPAAGGQNAVGVVQTAVNTDTNVAALRDSLLASGSSTEQAAAIMSSIKTLAYGNMVYNRMPADQAVAASIKSFTSQYEFLPNGGARMPVEKADTIKANAAAILRSLTPQAIAMPGLFGQPGQPKPDEYIGNIQAAPHWITSPNADALWLKDQFGRIVNDPKGAPIAVPFDAPPPPAPAVKPMWKPDIVGPLGQVDTSRFTGQGAGAGGDTEIVSAPGGWTGASSKAVDTSTFPVAIQRHLATLGGDQKKIIAYLNSVDPRGTYRGVSHRAVEDDALAGATSTDYKPGEVEAFNQQLDAQAHPDRQPGAVVVGATPGGEEPISEPESHASVAERHAATTAADLDKRFPPKPGEVSFTELERRRQANRSTSVAQNEGVARRMAEIQQQHDTSLRITDLTERAWAVSTAARHEILKLLDAKWDDATVAQKVEIAKLHMMDVAGRQLPAAVGEVREALTPSHDEPVQQAKR